MGNKISKSNQSQNASILTPEQIQEYTEAFYIFDQAGDGEIEVASIWPMMSALGQCIPNTDLRRLMAYAKVKNTFSLKQFLKIQEMRLVEQKIKEKLVEAFKCYEVGGNFEETFDNIKNTLEEAQIDLSMGKFEELARETLEGEGDYRYEEFLKMVTNKVG
ncbi:unnamed protein product [Blepharisma stoltei]|uniref:EF-hand domain-containing protein n=1 Tax=Blepharisma stoltei TaxID=1481888 RepID=A0AAU9JRQ8_9CILI|nr:unnamed protein product [Blepharisma stoltei]